MKTELLKVEIPGRPVPQSRPRFARSSGRIYYSKTSNNYRSLLVKTLKEEWEGRPPLDIPVYLVLELFGVRKGADADNVEKNIADALVDAKVLEDDSWQHIPIVIRMCAPSKDPRLILTILEGVKK
jgi:Holliday junction resolvase RusA-like endonuclease